ncbi:NUDIX domain-containing protein [Streptomyces sp. ISL-94]|uniref:NUDIX domain-containing protein n=1 Tax=Streptomyces sp. ISL-94 TaxID=2819190 RepID=UPI001BEB7482|nr:NUDIX domain-containing protein [Streptomyces sp. ISL-94]MBT2478376.1 NUDIX domain-containing protein [Streptomyces sp. ISL-94]
MTVIRIRTGACGPVVQEQHVLLVHGGYPEPDSWWPPGGGQRPGEPLNRTVEREVWEETGVRVETGPLLHLRERIPTDGEGDAHRVDALFWCRPLAVPTALGGSVPDDVQRGAEWVPLDRISSLRITPVYLRDLIPDLVAKAAAGEPSGIYVGNLA